MTEDENNKQSSDIPIATIIGTVKLQPEEPTKVSLIGIIKDATIIYGILVFLGFYQSYLLFEKLDISIYHYITTGEILLAFLPFVINIIKRSILLLLLVFIYLFSINFLRIYFKDKLKCSIWWQIVLTILLFVAFYIFYPKPNMSICDKMSFDLNLLTFYLSPNNIEHPVFTLDYITERLLYLLVFLSFIICYWFYKFIPWFYKLKLFKGFNKKFIPYSVLALLIVITICFLTVTTKIQSDFIRNGKYIQYVSFIYLNDTIDTNLNTNLIYIGKVKEYLFLRDRDNGDSKKVVNKIYNMKDVYKLEISDTIIEKPKIQIK
jgi:hypothetical protein